MYTEYKRDVSHNYLILCGEEKVNTASYQVRMLTGNTIPSILKCHMQGLDGKTMFYYDITSRQPVASFYEQRKFGAEDIDMLLRGVICVIEEMSEYLMNTEQLVLCPEYIFLDIEKKKVYFCCLPDYHHPIQEQFRELMEYLLPKINHEDQLAVKLGYGIYRKTMEPGLQLEHIKESIYKLQHISKSQDEEKLCSGYSEAENEKIHDLQQLDFDTVKKMENTEKSEDTKETEINSLHNKQDNRSLLVCIAAALGLVGIVGIGYLGYFPEIHVEIVLGAAILILAVAAAVICAEKYKIRKQEQKAEWRNKVKNKTDETTGKSFSEEINEQPIQEKSNIERTEIECIAKEPGAKTEYKEQYGETIVLSAGNISGPASLVSREPGELAPIYLENELTVIGKLENAADAVIALPTVSRIHARIRKIDEGYYLADLNSRNGTSVNGRILKAGEEYQLQDEDQVDFAQARYVFLNPKSCI